jgi:DNA repair protein SbcD/Mre11
VTRIVHTADWHLGARLIDCSRHMEHVAFLDWLLAQLNDLRPDLLIVAGDIFDSATPPQEALNLYYSFLSRLSTTVKCQVLILGGNHDSPATLHAPRDILRALDIRVIAAPPEDPADSLLELEHAVVCAVPYLRERDVRLAAPGQSADEVAAAIREGVTLYYRTVYALAQDRARGRSLIATGHLTVLGSAASPSERMIHIGNLGALDATCFAGFAYTALGHIHRPQAVGGDEGVRYAGSPLPLSFAEADLAKEIRVLDLAGPQLTQRAVPIPVFRTLLRLTTTVAALPGDLARHQAPAGHAFSPWVELTVTDGRAHPDLDRQIREAAAGLHLRILKVLTPQPASADVADSAPPPPALGDLSPADVFKERLRRDRIDPASPPGADLVLTFAELLSGLHDAAPTAPPEAGA